jgi:DNA-binding MarR family transcriptional regulator
MRSTSAARRAARAQPPEGDTERSLGDVLDFMRMLWALDHALQQRSKQMLVELGVTGPQRLVLRVIGRFPGIAAGDIAATMHLHPSTLTGILQRLERQRLIERRRDPADRRRALFVLTARGKKIDALRRGTAESLVRRTLAALPRARVAAARAVLRELHEHLEP